MKFFICSLIYIVIVFWEISVFAQSTIIDSVRKIKEDDEGKIIILNNYRKVLYLKNDQKNFEVILNEISNSKKFNSTIKFKTDANLNITEAK